MYLYELCCKVIDKKIFKKTLGTQEKLYPEISSHYRWTFIEIFNKTVYFQT